MFAKKYCKNSYKNIYKTYAKRVKFASERTQWHTGVVGGAMICFYSVELLYYI